MPGTRVAVTGTGASGKTMFLTSLLWRLREWENADFSLGKSAKIRIVNANFNINGNFCVN